MPPSRPIKIPKSVIDLIGPLTLSPFLCVSENSAQGFDLHCFIPNESLLLSSSISRIITSTSSPSCAIFPG